MKAIIFLALLGLTLQMHLIHDQTDIQRAYVISANNLNNDKINGLTVKFDKGRISFKGCNNNIASYQLGQDGKITINRNWMAPMILCEDDTDSLLKGLFRKVDRYTYTDEVLDLKDSSGNSMITLH